MQGHWQRFHGLEFLDRWVNCVDNRFFENPADRSAEATELAKQFQPVESSQTLSLKKAAILAKERKGSNSSVKDKIKEVPLPHSEGTFFKPSS